jgi:folate-binding protein YgfZ
MSEDPISSPTGVEGYAAIGEGAVVGAIEDRATLGVSGPARASFLQGLLTNDIEALKPGAGCYAAWLTPQGRLLTDLHVFESGDMILLDVPAAQAVATLERLEQFHFSEDVQLADLSRSLASVWVHGPSAPAVVELVVVGAERLASWDEYKNARASFDGEPAVVARVSQLGVPGFVVYLEPRRVETLVAAFSAAGAVVAGSTALEAARIEAAYPLTGIDMDDNTLPLETGIEPRAISFTKGCYVGQEVIIRVMHRGLGRVAKRLVLLHVSGGLPEPGASAFDGDREVGTITSAVRSPRFGPVALGYLHRDYVTPDTAVEIQADGGRIEAVVASVVPPVA